MKLKLVKILAWTGLLGLFAAGGGGCIAPHPVGITAAPSDPEPEVQLDGEIVCPASTVEEPEDEVELTPVPAGEENKDGKKAE